MPEKFLISKALDLRATALGKSTFSTLKGLLVLAGITSLCWFIWTGAIQPHTKWRVASTIQKAKQITNNNNYNFTKQHNIEIGWGLFKFWAKSPIKKVE